MNYRRLIASTAVLIALGAAASGQPQLAKPLTPEQKEKLKERDRFSKESTDLERAEKLSEAIVAAGKMLAIEREVFGDTHADVVGSLARLGRLHVKREDWPAARAAYRECVEVATTLSGKDGWHVTDARLALADVDLYAAMSASDRADLRRAEGLNAEADRFDNQGNYVEAAGRYQEALSIQRRLLGPSHRATLGCINNLARVYRAQGCFAEAEPLLKQALAGNRKALGDAHPGTLTNVNNLANLYQDLGRYAEAEPLLKEALAGRRKALGDAHPKTLMSVNDLAGLYVDQGRYAEAEPLFKEALAGFHKARGDAHRDTLITITNLAGLYVDQGRHAEAEPLYKEALAGRRKAFGDSHPDTLTTLNNLAELYLEQGRYAEAEPLLEKALAENRKALGNAHPGTLVSVNNLAFLYKMQRRYAEAELLLKETLAGNRKILGDSHPDTLASVNNLASLYYSQDRYAEAESLSRDCLDGIIKHLERTAVVQSETAQLANVSRERLYFTAFLKATAKADAATTYAFVLRWRGAVTARQTFARAARAVDPAAQALLSNLADVSRQISSLANNPPPPEKEIDIPARMRELIAQRDDIEARLVARAASFAGYVKNLALSPAELQKTLPAKTVLVDYVVYDDQLAAFVVRPNGISRVELGLVKTVATAVDSFHQTLNRVHATSGKSDDPAVVLRTTIWKPLSPYLKGAKQVLICPEGPLCRLPFAALPGSDPDKYLIEEVALAFVPVPRMLPELLAPRPPRGDAPPSLLAVGDVDFDAVPPTAVADGEPVAGVRKRRREGVARQWSRLPGTAGEIAELEVAFKSAIPGGKLTVLREKAATETAVRTALGQNEYLHLATHGYFADPSVGPKVEAPRDRGGLDIPHAAGPHPGLLSGLVFAGANKPREDDDGVLTALEVADLDLSKVELAVLSACETGLGETAGGEGVLGLQRAFQMAGARTTVTSLWKVDDDATRKLMGRFYASYWKENKGALESLRSAQLEMLANGLGRGMTKLEEGPPDPRPKRTPPYYWAAFVLAGDWQ